MDRRNSSPTLEVGDPLRIVLKLFRELRRGGVKFLVAGGVVLYLYSFCAVHDDFLSVLFYSADTGVPDGSWE